jgi:hypothetical protein
MYGGVFGRKEERDEGRKEEGRKGRRDVLPFLLSPSSLSSLFPFLPSSFLQPLTPILPKNQPVTTTGTPKVSHDNASQTLSPAKAEMRPNAERMPMDKGVPHTFQKLFFIMSIS